MHANTPRTLLAGSQNSIQIAEKADRNTLIQAHLEMWNVFVQQSQVTFDEVKALLSSLLPLMDYRTDRASGAMAGGVGIGLALGRVLNDALYRQPQWKLWRLFF